MNKKNILIIVSVLILILAGFFAYNNMLLKKPNNPTNESERKGYVYDAPYAYKVKNPSYKLNYRDLTINFKDAVVPYINLNSEDAKKANNELKKIYEEFVKEYEENSTKKDAYFVLKYDKYETQGILSVFNIFERYAFVYDSEIQNLGYSSYAFDLETKKLINFETAYKKLGYELNNIEEKVTGFIEGIIEEKYTGNDINEKKGLYDASLASFKESLKQGTTLFYVKDEGIVVVLKLHYGTGENEYSYPHITLVK